MSRMLEPVSSSPIPFKQAALDLDNRPPLRKPTTDTVVRSDPTTGPSAFSQEKPHLAPPVSSHGIYQLLAILERLSCSGKTLARAHGVALQQTNNECDALIKEQSRILEEAAKRTQAQRVWDALKQAATVVLAALSALFGITLLAVPGTTVLGVALIASGILTIANLAMSDLGAWDWVARKLASDNEKKRQWLAILLPAAVSFVAGALALGGGPAALQAWHTMSAVQRAVVVLTTAAAFADGSIQIGKGVSDTQATWLQTELERSQTSLTLNELQSEKITSWIRALLESLAQASATAEQIIARFVQTNSLVRR